MISKVFVLLSLVAVSLCASVSDPLLWRTDLIDGDELSSDVQDYLKEQFVSLPEYENEVELTDPPQPLQEVALSELGLGQSGTRMKRRVVVCRYVAIRTNRTKKPVVIVRCPK
uniref:Uncharacterized protein n=1 Tax=Eristalis tenax TaxID=198635 RepID=A4VBB1_ERITN|nr:hypothetical protein [Eristalis tenax]